jgi:hypothetical protein
MDAASQVGFVGLEVQPNGTLVSMPMTTAIFPALITLRAWNGSVTIR